MSKEALLVYENSSGVIFWAGLSMRGTNGHGTESLSSCIEAASRRYRGFRLVSDEGEYMRFVRDDHAVLTVAKFIDVIEIAVVRQGGFPVVFKR